MQILQRIEQDLVLALEFLLNQDSFSPAGKTERKSRNLESHRKDANMFCVRQEDVTNSDSDDEYQDDSSKNWDSEDDDNDINYYKNSDESDSSGEEVDSNDEEDTTNDQVVDIEPTGRIVTNVGYTPELNIMIDYHNKIMSALGLF